MAKIPKPVKDVRVTVRINGEDREAIEAAAAARGVTMSAYMVQHAARRARRDLGKRGP